MLNNTLITSGKVAFPYGKGIGSFPQPLYGVITNVDILVVLRTIHQVQLEDVQEELQKFRELQAAFMLLTKDFFLSKNTFIIDGGKPGEFATTLDNYVVAFLVSYSDYERVDSVRDLKPIVTNLELTVKHSKEKKATLIDYLGAIRNGTAIFPTASIQVGMYDVPTDRKQVKGKGKGKGRDKEKVDGEWVYKEGVKEYMLSSDPAITFKLYNIS